MIGSHSPKGHLHLPAINTQRAPMGMGVADANMAGPVSATDLAGLAIGALFQVFDGPQATLMGTLRGYKDTRAPMMIALVAYWLFGLPVGAVLCFGLWSIPGIGVHGMWWGLVVGLVVVATALFARLARVSGDPVRVAQLRLR